ncbi:secreted RxLR effector protein 161-like [Primulina eburnea]|uniref:secreted RxLR effector protein 161-like n=1 Tax=Primulina eburnea TaxID=1245227 RepID=UPI003C6C8378
MDNAKPLPTPMVSGLKLSSQEGDLFDDVTLYRSTVGALQYLTITRPYIAYSVNKVCQFMQAPLHLHWKAVKRILRYLNGTMNFCLQLTASASLHLHGYCDADWANDPDDRRSTSGFCWFLGGSPIVWCSKKQPIVSRSSTEAEYRSLANATSELIWLQSLITELHIPLSKTPVLWCDNLSTISLSANPVLHSKSKHIELDLYFVREKVLFKHLSVQHVPSIDQAGDILT